MKSFMQIKIKFTFLKALKPISVLIQFSYFIIKYPSLIKFLMQNSISK